MVFRLKEKQAAAAQLRKHFRLAFQSLGTLTNLDGAAKGRPMLSVTTEKRGGTDILWAGYDADMMMEPSDPAARKAEGDKDNGEAKDAGEEAKAKANPANDLHYNFSPALVISKNHLILCSTKQLADQLAGMAEKEGPVDNVARIPQNTLVELSAAPVAALLRANRDQLVAKNILEKGSEREEAEKQVDLLIKVVEGVRGAKLSLTPTEKTMTLELEITAEAAK